MTAHNQMGDLIQSATEEVGREGTHLETLSHGEKVNLAAMGHLAASIVREIKTIKAAVSLPVWVAAAGLFGNLAWRVFELAVLGIR